MNGIAYYINDANLQLNVFRESCHCRRAPRAPLQWIPAALYRFQVIQTL